MCGLLEVKKLRQLGNECAYFIAHSPVMRQSLFGGFCRQGESRRVIEAMMKPSRPAGKDRTSLVGMAADGDDEIIGETGQSIERFRLVPGNVDSLLGHDLHGIFVQPIRRDTGRLNVEKVGPEGPGPAFGHLAPA